ncbi:serine/threonine protein phosphatase [Methylobacterium indicum]|uniref:DEAD/DEAH box helicase n=1 Tax=Methylobacterium indicum TaxID=1775910 RepID=UPI000734DCB3|nr:DEAD/DEAH box helicase [Methylobacterium indicum]KTS38138.1 serine/threonine protein phosphatase [Methylobacterium indicum]KTS40065.1 serine/threonine protein phosphatase [Methylobacterium indicum]KTS54259.1 serine/threonine protein phosphatase [Methylobacterium indicum]
MRRTSSFTERDILRNCGHASFHDGARDLAAGRVREIGCDGDNTIEGDVESRTGKTVYSVTVAVEKGRTGTVITGHCTCPDRTNCRHVAAVLLGAFRGTVLRAPPPPPPTPETRAARLLQLQDSAGPEALPSELESWIRTLDRARRTGSEAFPPEIDRRLIYVLLALPGHGGTAPRLGVAPMQARILKSGALSAKARPVEPYAIVHAGTPSAYLRPSDLRILKSLAGRPREAEADAPPAYSLLDEAGAEILERVLATGRARFGTVLGPALAAGPPRPGRIDWVEGEETLAPHPRLDDGDGTGAGPGEEADETTSQGTVLALAAQPPAYLDPGSGLVGPIEVGVPPHLAAALMAAPAVPAASARALNAALAEAVPDLPLRLPEPPRETIVDVAPVPVLRLFQIEAPAPFLYGQPPSTVPVRLAALSFRYGPVAVPFGDPRQRPSRLAGGRLHVVERDGPAERRAVARLLAHGLSPLQERRTPLVLGYAQHQAHARDFLPDAGEDAWPAIQAKALPGLEAAGFEVTADPSFRGRVLHPDGAVEVAIRESTGIDWLELDLGVEIEGERIPLAEPVAALLAQPGFAIEALDETSPEPVLVPLPDGRVLALPAARLRPILLALRELSLGGTGEGGRLKLGLVDAATLAALERASAEARIAWRGGESLRAMGRRLLAEGGIPPVAPPEGFRAALRPYQAEGLSWLSFLREAGLGGILADDMGLGKTVQALALIAREKADGRLDRPALVVAPTSLMANWRREAERFAPDLAVLVLHGLGRREHFDAIPRHDLVLTTYPLVARDQAVLGAQAWHLLVLDEAQTIKNPDAATTQIIRALTARHRFCLSGTPLENNLAELWSLFSFACPGLLGERRTFARDWRTPIEKHGDAERGRLLARRIRPFLLRRTKEEVARDLPAKTEITEEVEMGEAQRALYDSIRLAMHARVQEAIAAKGWERSRIVVLDALLKLRQACCDPRLLKLEHAAEAGSAKLERLEELLEALLAEGRRVLVFSQFTSMLALIKPRLDRAGIAYTELTGRTRDREGAIRRFEAGAARVFLISLKAGGTGLNLVAADTVILYDPWWNPAVEAQATDRAHRIGQDKPVFVHRIVAARSIEEKMEALKARKSALAEALFDHDGAPTRALTAADIDALLEA